MITQGILDFFSMWVAGLLEFIPPMPASWQTWLANIASGGSSVGSWISKLSPIVPLSVISVCIQAWVGALTFWLAMLGLRLVLWLVGR